MEGSVAAASPGTTVQDLLAELSPYARIDDSATASRLGRSLDDPTAFVHHVATQLGTADRMVATSVAFLTVTNRAALPLALANEALGIQLAPPLEALRWRVVDGMVRLGFADDRSGPAVPWTRWVEQFVADIVGPWAELVAAHTRIGRRLLWGNAAASLLAAVHQVAASTARSAVEALAMAEEAMRALPLGALAVVGGGPTSFEYRRRTCCLLFKAPGSGRCGDCSLDRPA